MEELLLLDSHDCGSEVGHSGISNVEYRRWKREVGSGKTENGGSSMRGENADPKTEKMPMREKFNAGRRATRITMASVTMTLFGPEWGRERVSLEGVEGVPFFANWPLLDRRRWKIVQN